MKKISSVLFAAFLVNANAFPSFFKLFYSQANLTECATAQVLDAVENNTAAQIIEDTVFNVSDVISQNVTNGVLFNKELIKQGLKYVYDYAFNVTSDSYAFVNDKAQELYGNAKDMLINAKDAMISHPYSVATTVACFGITVLISKGYKYISQKSSNSVVESTVVENYGAPSAEVVAEKKNEVAEPLPAVKKTKVIMNDKAVYLEDLHGDDYAKAKYIQLFS